MKWIILISGIASNAAASVLVKLALTPPRRFPSIKEPLAALSNWPLWLGLVLYGCAFLLYALALSKLPLNIAHPILTAGSIATVAVLSMLVFKEPMYWTTLLGILLIVISVFLLGAHAGR